MALIINNSRGQSHKGVKLQKQIVAELLKGYVELDKIVELNYSYANLKGDLLSAGSDCSHFMENNKNLPSPIVFIGGDHLSSFSTILGSLIRYGNDFRLVWIDAHADIHSLDTSPSWNMHGMVVRLLMTHTIPNIKRLLPYQLFYVGLRSVEVAEWEYIFENNIDYISQEMWLKDREGCLRSLSNFIKSGRIHISLDVDAIDPSELDSTGTLEKEGLTISDMKLVLMTIFKDADRVYALDIMEYNPDLGDHSKSMANLRQLLQLFFVN